MKLLLVDDENHVREGILSMIDWKMVRVDRIEKAVNGNSGLETALEFEPDIILTDVRMPKMDGIEMAFAIRNHLPLCSIIFMSGYSDKEYLKSAIQLSAINYVEKPIDLEELTQAISDAVHVQEEKKAWDQMKADMDGQLKVSMAALRNQLVLDLTKKSFQNGKRMSDIKMGYPDISPDHAYVTIIIDLVGIKSEDGLKSDQYRFCQDQSIQTNIRLFLENQFAEKGWKALVGSKDEHLLLIHIDLGKEADSFLVRKTERAANWIKGLLDDLCYSFVSVGNRVDHLNKIYESYNNAAAIMLQSFYYETGRILRYEELGKREFVLSDHYLVQFEEILKHGTFETAVDFIQSIIIRLREYPQKFIFAVKEFFFRMMKQVLDHACRQDITQFVEQSQSIIREAFWEYRFLSQVETYLIEQLELYYNNIKEDGGRQTISEKVKYYVSCNYSEPDLSLATIAQKLSLTGSYLCILFKKECKMTLTAYIIEYRMTKAKTFLEDEGRRIKDIALMTGYMDCNYFIKVFKKYTGETPAEYRKRIHIQQVGK